MEEAKWAKREVKSSFTNYLHHSKCLLPKFLLKIPPSSQNNSEQHPFVGGKPLRGGFCEASSMSQAWLVVLKGKHVVQKPCNMSCSRYPCSWRLFPHLSPASSKETDGEIILSGEKSSRRATKPPITGVFLPVPSPLVWVCPHRALTAALAQLWAALAANTAAPAAMHGPEDISNRGPGLIPVLQHWGNNWRLSGLGKRTGKSSENVEL